MLKSIKDTYNVRIIKKIAEGGMGAVYEAIQDGIHGFQKTVALKTVLPHFSDDDAFVKMFIQEAKLVANLVQENIVQIYQLGKNEEGYYFVMEYVKGLSLFEFIRYHNLKSLMIPRELVILIASRIARGLSYAHSRFDNLNRPMGIVHRDVCPANILITTEGLPKLTDFGIASVTSMQAVSEAKLSGKLRYISPEQASKQSVDFRADIFSLGTVIFEMFSGKKVRYSETESEMLEHAKSGLVNWDYLPKDLSKEVLLILHKCLAVNKEERYSTTDELGKALEYSIYKDGYGPTVNTLKSYMQEHFSILYITKKKMLSLDHLKK